ncbi:hypothetical protein MYX84_15970, partial [Acidobacteria bacterium AH-259-O06]|nr:hypothetical protein [Acidobacteria bacterium AH-259-O06]
PSLLCRYKALEFSKPVEDEVQVGEFLFFPKIPLEHHKAPAVRSQVVGPVKKTRNVVLTY